MSMFEWQEEFDGGNPSKSPHELRRASDLFRGIVDDLVLEFLDEAERETFLTSRICLEGLKLEIELDHEDALTSHTVFVHRYEPNPRTVQVMQSLDGETGTASAYNDYGDGKVVRSDAALYKDGPEEDGVANVMKSVDMGEQLGLNRQSVGLSEVRALRDFLFSGEAYLLD